jgi:hypothetical protein
VTAVIVKKNHDCILAVFQSNIIWLTSVTVWSIESVMGYIINQICIMLFCKMKGMF